MKKSCFSAAWTIFAAVLLTGCNLWYSGRVVEIHDPGMSMLAESCTSGQKTTIPPAEDDPEPICEPPRKKRIPQAVKPVKVKKEVPVKKAEVQLIPEKKQEIKPQPEIKAEAPENFRRGPGLWRAFSRLPQQEQKELLKLQRSNPERYREIMQKKVDQLYEQEKQRKEEFDKLVATYNSSSDEQEKSKLKEELRRKLLASFRQRLQDTRRDIESHKRRTAFLEAELLKRENNCDAIVEALLQKRLSGESEKKSFPVIKAEKK